MGSGVVVHPIDTESGGGVQTAIADVFVFAACAGMPESASCRHDRSFITFKGGGIVAKPSPHVVSSSFPALATASASVRKSNKFNSRTAASPGSVCSARTANTCKKGAVQKRGSFMAYPRDRAAPGWKPVHMAMRWYHQALLI